MHRRIVFSVVAILVLVNLASAQVRRGRGIVPESSIERLEDLGVRMHTNYLILAPEGTVKPAATPGGETPASLGCIYDVVSNPVAGCPIASATEVPTGGSGVIVIVDAYDDPSAAADMATFSTEFGLPAPNFLVKYASGTKPANACSSGWELRNLSISSGHMPWRRMHRSS
jgi:kumamolisin